MYHLLSFLCFPLMCFYLQLFVGGLMSFCLLTYSGVQHILCCVAFLFSLSCVPYVASFSGLSIFNCLFGIL